MLFGTFLIRIDRANSDGVLGFWDFWGFHKQIFVIFSFSVHPYSDLVILFIYLIYLIIIIILIKGFWGFGVLGFWGFGVLGF